MDVALFRSQFPEFAEETAFPDAQVSFWLTIATTRLNATRWGALLDAGLALYMAHNLSLARQNAKAAAFGGVIGQNTGPMASKTVDKVSATYDTKASTNEGDGHYNLTDYGTRFMELVRLAGMGGLQLGGAEFGDMQPALGFAPPWF